MEQAFEQVVARSRYRVAWLVAGLAALAVWVLPSTARSQSCPSYAGQSVCIDVGPGVVDPDFPFSYPDPTNGWDDQQSVDDVQDIWRVVPDWSPGNITAGEILEGMELSFDNSTFPRVVLSNSAHRHGEEMDLGPYQQDQLELDWAGEDLPPITCGIGIACGTVPAGVPVSTFPRDPAVGEPLALGEALGTDPVNPDSGEFVIQEADLALPSFGVSFSHVRTYRSRIAYDGPLGHGWDHSYNQRLVKVADTDDILYATGQGTTIRFYRSGQSAGVPQVDVFEPPIGVTVELVRQAGVFTMLWPNGQIGIFDERGLLQSLEDRNGHGLTLLWEASPRPDGFRLSSVLDSAGRKFLYSYGADGRLSRVGEASSGLDARYEYDAAGDLRKATDSRATSESYDYSTSEAAVEPDYVPEWSLRAGCELACAPTGSQPGAGGGCDGAIDDGRQACFSACGSCVSQCNAGCGNYCGEGGEGYVACGQGCDAACGSICSDELAAVACDEYWNDYGKGACDDCEDQVKAVCGDRCVNAASCLLTTDGNFDLGHTSARAIACAAEHGIGPLVDDIKDALHTGLAGHLEALWCGLTFVCNIPFVPCDSDCDFDWTRETLAETCNDVCTLCLARGKLEDCAPSPSSCISADGCRAECEAAFWGREDQACGGQNPGCLAAATHDCKQECGYPCRAACRGDCDGECRDGCWEACDPQACVGECVAVPDAHWVGLCEESCTDGCVASGRMAGPHPGPKYGYPQDLAHNIVKVYDGNGALYVENAYGDRIGKPSFDAVVSQHFGKHVAELHYRNLDYERRVTDELEQREMDVSRISNFFGNLGVDEVAEQHLVALDDYDAVEICQTCLPPRPALPEEAEIFVPWQQAVLAVSAVPRDQSPDGFEVLASVTAPIPPLALIIARTASAVYADPVLDPSSATSSFPPTFTFGARGSSARVTATRGSDGRYALTPSSTAKTVLAGAQDLVLVSDVGGSLRLFGGRINAIHHLAVGSCTTPFVVDVLTNERIRVTPQTACSNELLVAPLASLIRDNATRGALLSDPFHVSKSSSFVPTRLLPFRGAVELLRDGVGTYEVRPGPAGGSAPPSLGRAAEHAIDQLRLLLWPGAGAATVRPVFVLHLPASARRHVAIGTLGAARIGLAEKDDSPTPTGFVSAIDGHVAFDELSEMVLPPGPQCGSGYRDQPRRGDAVVGHRPIRATVLIDSNGSPHAMYTDHHGRMVRTVDIGTGATTSFNWDRYSNLVGVEGPMGERSCMSYDALGNRRRQVDFPTKGGVGGLEPRVSSWTYDVAGWPGSPVRLTTVHGPDDVSRAVATLVWDRNGNLLSETSVTGETTSFTLAADGVPESIAYANGSTSKISWSPTAGRPRSVTLSSPTLEEPLTTTMEWDDAGRPLRVEAPSGAEQHWKWQGARLRSRGSSGDGASRHEEFDYDSDGQLRSVVGPTAKVSFDYLLTGGLRKTTVEARDGSVAPLTTCQQTMPDGRVLAEVAADGTRLRYEYQETGVGRTVVTYGGSLPADPGSWDDDCAIFSPELSQVAGILGSQRFDQAGRLVASADSVGHTTEIRYDGFGRPAVAQLPDGTSIQAGYSPGGRVLWRATYAPMAGSASYRAPAAGTPGLLAAETFQYDHAGRLAAHDVWQLDEQGRPAANNYIRRTTYLHDDAAGKITVVDPEGNMSVQYVDALGRATDVVLPSGETVQTRYRNRGRTVTTTVTNLAGTGTQTSTILYNAVGAVTSVLHGSPTTGLTLSTRSYDSLGRVEYAWSSDGSSQSFEYDELERVAGTVRWLGSSGSARDSRCWERLTPRVDAVGRVLERSSTTEDGSAAQVSRYHYDALGRLARLELPEGVAEQYTYSGTSPQLDLREDARGVVVDHDHDVMGRLTAQSVGPFVRQYKYDPLGRLASAFTNGSDVDDPSDDVATRFRWDSRGSRIHESHSQLAATVDHVVDGLGRPSVSTLGDTTVQRAYDRLGRLENVTIGGVSTISFGYTGLGGPTKIDRSSGVSTTLGYDSRGRLIRQRDMRDNEELASWRWEMPLSGIAPQVAGLSMHGQQEISSVYQIGDGGRLLTEANGIYGLDGLGLPAGGSIGDANDYVATVMENSTDLRRYDLDAHSNWTARRIHPEPAETVKSDSLNRYHQVGTRTFAYDERGAVLSDGVRTFEYDVWGLPTSVSTADGKVTLRHDALGRVISQTNEASGATETYGYDGMDRALRARADGTVESLVYGGQVDEVLAVVVDGDVQHVHQDRQRSPYLVTSGTGKPLEWYRFSAYGERQIWDSSGGGLDVSSIDFRLGFQGHPQDPVTGLVDMRSRLYAPDIGRFTTPDPAGQMDGTNVYAFLDAAVLSFLDPLGLAKTCPAGCHRSAGRDDSRGPGPSFAPHERNYYGDQIMGGLADFIEEGLVGVIEGVGDSYTRLKNIDGRGFHGVVSDYASDTAGGFQDLAVAVYEDPGAVKDAICAKGCLRGGVKVTATLATAAVSSKPTLALSKRLAGGAKRGITWAQSLDNLGAALGAAGQAAARRMKRVAFGLSRHPKHGYSKLLGRFSNHVEANTYWDIYPGPNPELPVLGERIASMMNDADSIHFNLDGLIKGDNIKASFVEEYNFGAAGLSDPGVTNWELYYATRNFSEKTFYYIGDRRFRLADLGVTLEDLGVPR